MRMIDGVAVWGDHEQATIEQIKRCAADEHVAGAALLSDGHLGYSMPIGGVIAYRRARLAPEKVGYLPLPEGIFAQRIRSITTSIPEEVYDLSIDHPGHSFVCEGMIVHNCWREKHNGEEVMVVRKGATPAFPGQRGFIGGSMGDISVIVEGMAGEESALALHSTVHGAGRVMSRTRAAGKRRWTKIDGRRVQQQVRPGEISTEMMHDWLRRVGVELRGGGTDESPHVYRRLPDVLAQHSGTIRILHTLTPLGVAMAGEDVFDPYKD